MKTDVSRTLSTSILCMACIAVLCGLPPRCSPLLMPVSSPAANVYRLPINQLITIHQFLPYTPMQTQVDFAQYKNLIKNQKVLSELEQSFKSFKPVDYDVNAQLKAIDAFQEKAVSHNPPRFIISRGDLKEDIRGD
jgi:hypothetical protein